MQVPSWLGNALTSVAAVLLLVVAFFFSLIAFAVVAVGGLCIWAWLWWKTRALRKELRDRPPGGRVIEGEASREVGSGGRIER